MPERYFIGVDGGTESLRAAVFDARGKVLGSSVTTYETSFPKPSWAEQNPDDWWSALGSSVKAAISSAGIGISDIAAICLDTTSCSVVALEADGTHVRPALIWMDIRASQEAAKISSCADDALRLNGYGAVSAEWMAAKALWLLKNEPANFERARFVCEYQDYLNFRLTGRMTGSLNNVSIRWHYDNKNGGFQKSLYEKIGLTTLLEKFPSEIIAMGDPIGNLTNEAAQHLGLSSSTLVVQGGADAFVAMIGLGVVEPEKLAFITGSSHLHLGLSAKPFHAKGLWGTYSDAVIKGLHTIEGGQTSTGSVIAWLRRILGDVDLETLNHKALQLRPGADGLVVLEHFQGNRTPHTDPNSRGVISGLTLKHGAEHLFRAVIEGVAFGTEDIFATMREAGYVPNEFIMCGGATRSNLWMQIHADVSGVPITLTESPDAAMLGSGILAAVGAGEYSSIGEACSVMVKTTRIIEPNLSHHQAYKPLLEMYRATYANLKTTLHAQAAIAREN